MSRPVKIGLAFCTVVLCSVLLAACATDTATSSHRTTSTVPSTITTTTKTIATTTTTPVVVDHGAKPATMTSSRSYCPVASDGPNFYAPSIPGGGKTVALTFDDGPGPSTAAILAVLEEYGVRATFFNVGTQEAAWPAEVRAEARDGFLIGNHTWNHADLAKLPPVRQAREMNRVIAQQEALAGTSPCVFRPPYGDYNATTLRLARQRHMALWMWSVDTEDWEAEGSASSSWVDRIVTLAESEGGSLQHPVVVLHNQQIPMPATVAALPVIIQYFESHGYTFVDLLGNSGPPASCAPSVTVSRSPGTLIQPDVRLSAGDVVDSPGGQYRLVMQEDGDLVLYVAGGRPLWASGTADSPGAYAVMQSNGNFAIFSGSGGMLWETATAGRPGAALAVQRDADLVIYEGSKALWSSGSTNSELGVGERLNPGWYLTSPDGMCRLVMQVDGDLSLRSASGATLWTSMTRGSPGAFALMRTNGDLVLYSALHKLLWETGTTGMPGARLVLRPQAESAIELPTGSVAWLPVERPR